MKHDMVDMFHRTCPWIMESAFKWDKMRGYESAGDRSFVVLVALGTLLSVNSPASAIPAIFEHFRS